jgi:anti-sigma regulatory factor (Ser/Thr protein kinase)
LQRLATNARRLASGEPALPVGGNDELSDLDVVYRSMAERIAESSRAHAEALEHLERERRVATLLQQTLLPQIPAIAGLRIDSAYATPPDGARVGGDWFDVFVLSERLVGLSVGDVTGHSLAAVASMGFVRQAIRVVARMRPDPAHVLERVNRIVCDEAGSISTAFFAVYDRIDGDLRYALAGHCPPLVFAADGRAEPLAGSGLMLGLDSNTCFAEHRRSLVPGETLVLYTDGAVEVERDYLKGMIDLEDAVRAELNDPFGNVAERVQRRIFERHAPLDDSALLIVSVDALQTATGTATAPRRFDARDRDTAHRVKQELLSALKALPAPPDIDAAELVYGELISNVVRHTPGPARVWYDAFPDCVVLNVEDAAPPFYTNGALSGHGSPPDASAEGGRGLYIVRALSENVAIEAVPGGKRTSVTLRSLPRNGSLRKTG